MTSARNLVLQALLVAAASTTLTTVSAQTRTTQNQTQNAPQANASQAAQAPSATLAAERAAVEKTRAELQKQRNILETQQEALTTQENALRQQENALSQGDESDAQQQALTLQKAALKAQKAALQPQFEALQSQEAALQTRVKKLQTQEAALEAQRAATAQAKQQAQAALEARQGQLDAFFAALGNNPELTAARAALRAAEQQLEALYGPATLETTAGFTSLGLNDLSDGAVAPQQVGEVPADGSIPTTSERVSANVTFRPFPFGDVADAVRQAELAARSSLLDYRNTLTSLETRALGAAFDLRLAQQSLELSQEGVALARDALKATQTRFQRGAANARELRNAQANFQEAQNFALNARENVRIARLNLVNLVGDAAVPDFNFLGVLPTPPTRTPLSVLRAEIPVEQAAVGVSAERRDVYPTLQASYNYNLDDKSSLSASIESRTLQPSVGYSYQNPARTLPDSAIRSNFTVGVSATIPLDGFDAIDAARAQLDAARAGLQASRDGAAVQSASLTSVRTQAARTLSLKEIQFRNAQADFRENQQRQELGLIAPLETQQALVDLLDADLELRQARQSTLRSLFDLYTFYALPPSEVLR